MSESVKASNLRLILEPYTASRDLRHEVVGGFARAAQIDAVVGLKLLMPAIVLRGTLTHVIPMGTVAYIKEKSLRELPWGKSTFKADGVEGPFLIVDPLNVEFFVEPS